jgi:hypothetical protein
MRSCRLRATANLLDPSAGHFGEKSRIQETFPALACESHLKTIVLDQDDQDPPFASRWEFAKEAAPANLAAN